MLRKSAGLILVLFILNGAVFAEEAPHISSFVPRGTVKTIRQAHAVFSSAMVSFGDSGAGPNPFTITCSEPGRGRWVDPHNWVYDFERDLPGGIRCTFKAVSGLAALDGQKLAGEGKFSFSTGGPAVVAVTPYDGDSRIAEDQIFILTLDTPASEASVLGSVGFAIAGIRQRVDAQIVKGEQREAILKANSWLLNSGTDPGRYLLLQCRQRFPEQARVNLIWGKGVKSATGVATQKDQMMHFKVRDAFIAEFRCERENPRAGCIPVLPFSLDFNAPLDPELSGDVVLKGPGGSIQKVSLNESQGQVRFNGPFPENAEFRLEIPEGLKDDAGRRLSNAGRFPLKFRTGAYPSLAKFAARFGIIELNADPALPVTLRNIEPDARARMVKVENADTGLSARVTGRSLNISPERVGDVQSWLRKVAAASREKSLFEGEDNPREFTVPKTRGTGAFEVVGIPLKKPGLYVVEIESAILGKALLDPPKPMFVPSAALVTNMSVHFKQGRESSLVWVTTLDQGEPVKAAGVAVMDCKGKILWKGSTDDSGIARIGETLPDAANLPECPYEQPEYDDSRMGALRSLGQGLFITARAGDDMSFVHSSWNEGIEAWRFNLPSERDLGPITAHTIFDRSLLRAGETLHMKHVIRARTTGGFSVPSEKKLPETAFIRHIGSSQTYAVPLSWDATGVAETVWEIPREARLGGYSVTLGSRNSGKTQETQNAGDEDMVVEEDALFSGQFRVEEFRIPLLKATIQTQAEPLVNCRDAMVDLSVRYLSGGGAGLLPVKLRTAVSDKALSVFEGFEDVVFGNGGIREGIFRQGKAEDDGEETAVDQPSKPQTQDLALDANGFARAQISKLPKSDRPREMTVEMEFGDPSGEIQTVSTRIPLWNSGLMVGIWPENWARSTESLRFRTAVVDLSGKPVAGAPVKVTLFQRNVISHRKRLVGGYYSYDHSTEIRRIGTFFEGKTDSGGLLRCEGKAPVSGEVILVAESRDAAGNRTLANQSIWIAGKKEWWFESEDHDRMDLIPVKKRFEPGETAGFQVRMPFREATALISVEREGVMETWVQKLSGRDPVIAVPVLGNYAPNVFVSVLAVRGRISDIQPTAMADLGKPAFKIGMAEINVGWKAHELKVAVTTDRKTYKVREKAAVSVKVTTADGKTPPPGTEVALAAVDEGLLELMGNASWNILPAMMGRRACSVQTATAQMQVVGKRHFGLKALAQGGGGGRQTTRELFDTLLLWKARLPLNDRGEAEIELPLNDSITAFRIVAVATGGTGLFGTGSASIQSSQDLTIFSGLPPLVREGDAYRAGVTVRNASRQPMTVKLSARAAGISALPAVQEALSPGESREIGWDVTAPSGVDSVSWEIDAVSEEGAGQDRIRLVQKVLPAVPLRVFQATLSRVEGEFSMPVALLQGVLAGGGIRVGVRARLGDSQTAVADYMKNYPYGCLEQKVSMAVALRDKARWDHWMARISAYMDADGLAKYFPVSDTGDPVLTAYLIAISHEAGWSLPKEFIQQAATGLRKFVEGSIIRHGTLPSADLILRKLSAIEALSRIGKADAGLLGSVVIEPNAWPTSAIIDWVNILSNLSPIPGQKELKLAAEQVLRSRLSYQGTVVGFSTEDSDRLCQLMVSNDVNAVRLVLTALRLEGWESDIPKIVRGALGRQKAGKWDLTTANAWGVLAMEKFSKRFEPEPVTGETTVTLSNQSHRFDWAVSPEGSTLTLSWPFEKTNMTAVHQGQGKPWLSLQSLAAIPLKAPISSGYEINKTITSIEQKTPGRWTRGDIVRMRLEIRAQSDMTWVAVSDPVPAGAAILGTGLGRDSRLLTRDEDQKGVVRPAFVERSLSEYRAYFDYAPRGTWTMEYTLRLNQSGSFQLPQTRVEALYAPEMFGESPNAPLKIEP
ncbi:MAG: alpha-2-macroglobulin [Deltaproteobacteria bacterium]|nr:alpha-2-macroglobulin [Deltaproteobacteria bacterium]